MFKTIFIALYLIMIPIFTYAHDNRWEWFFSKSFPFKFLLMYNIIKIALQ